MIGLLGIPFDKGSSFLRGSAKAPGKIRGFFHSKASNYYTELGVDLENSPEWKDLGDLRLPRGPSVLAAIQAQISKFLIKTEKILSLGGDHSVTYPILKAYSKNYKKLSILHIDAHPDLYESFEGNKFSHACPFTRIMEEGLAQRLVQIGIRKMNELQELQAKRFGVESFPLKDWNSAVELKFDGPVYLSLDLDVFDPAFAPGVSHPEPGGFSSREVLSIIHKLQAQVVGADIVEYNPKRDPSGITGMLAAKLAKELLGLMLKY